jgi:small subunit ribosomal protein S2
MNSSVEDDPEIKAMIDAGVHLGHAKNKRHPAMEPYIWTVKGGISVIDVTKTKEKLDEALAFLKSVSQKGGFVLFVGTRPAAKAAVADTAKALGMPWVTERWIGGTLTNFKVISKQVETLSGLEAKMAGGEFEKYTKKERIGFEKEIARLKKYFDGLRALLRQPAALFVVNVPHDHTAIREATRMRIPVVALTDTNADPRTISYPIPSNDDAMPVIRYMLERVRKAVEEGRDVVDAEKPKE